MWGHRVCLRGCPIELSRPSCLRTETSVEMVQALMHRPSGLPEVRACLSPNSVRDRMEAKKRPPCGIGDQTNPDLPRHAALHAALRTQRVSRHRRDAGATRMPTPWAQPDCADLLREGRREPALLEWNQAGFRLALGDDRRSLALADANAAGDAHGDESGDECEQNFLHWNPLCW